MNLKHFTVLLLVLMTSVNHHIFAQKDQEQLEQRRQALQKEIDQINTLVIKGKTEQKSVLSSN